MKREDLIASIAERIATFEGYFVSKKQSQNTGAKFPTLAQKNNNPGNIRSWGKSKIVGGYAVFDTPEAGWTALRHQIGLLIDRGLTTYEFFGGKKNVYPGYAPEADKNQPNHYAEFVAKGIPCSPDIPLNTLITSDKIELAGEKTNG